jgi:hypothetical protein
MVVKRPSLTRPFNDWNDKTMNTDSFRILTGLKENDVFTPMASLIESFELGVTDYRNKLAAAASRDKDAVLAKNNSKISMVGLLNAVTDSVTQIAGGDLAVLQLSNLPVRKGRQPVQPKPPTGLELTTGNVAGTLYTKVKDVKGKRLYFVEYKPNTITDSSVWKRIDTSKCNCTIPGLDSGTKYWVRVGVISSNDEKLWGDAILSPYIP